MAKEIERKFLVDAWLLPYLTNGKKIKQGYISKDNNTVRVRIIEGEAYITIKGKQKGITRLEFEYQIPMEDAKEMMEELCGDLIVEKTRYLLPSDKEGQVWELDVFEGRNKGLIIVEIELEDENEEISFPEWILEEVMDKKYNNSNLSFCPYSIW